MEMVLLMYDDNAGNVYCKYLEDIIARRDKIIDGLKEDSEYQEELIDQLEEDKRFLNGRLIGKNLIISELLEEKKAFEITVLATQIQAAESEHRAEQENHKRLQYLMRR